MNILVFLLAISICLLILRSRILIIYLKLISYCLKLIICYQSVNSVRSGILTISAILCNYFISTFVICYPMKLDR